MRGPLTTFVLSSFAVATLTRLVVADTIADRPREWLSRSEAVEKLITCPWCVSFWLSIAVGWVAAWNGYEVGLLTTLASWGAGKTVYWATEALASSAARD